MVCFRRKKCYGKHKVRGEIIYWWWLAESNKCYDQRKIYSSEFSGVLGRYTSPVREAFKAEEMELHFHMFVHSGEGHILTGKLLSCFLPHSLHLNLLFQYIINNILFQFQNVLTWTIINNLIILVTSGWALGIWERMWGEELENVRRLCSAQCDFFPRSCKWSLKLLTSWNNEYDWFSYGK